MNMETMLFIPTFLCLVFIGGYYLHEWTGWHLLISGPIGGIAGGVLTLGIWYLKESYLDYSLRKDSHDSHRK